MTEGPPHARRLLARTTRVIAGAALLAGSAALLLRRPPTAGHAARGGFNHLPSAASLHEGYEVKDLSARGLVFVLAGLGGSAAVLVGIVFLMIRLFSGWDASSNAGLTAEQRATVTPPGPHLQLDAVDDLHRERARELAALQGYAWIDPGHTRAHIPIDRAMAVVAGHSLDDAP